MLYRSRPVAPSKLIASGPIAALPEVFVGSFMALITGWFVFSRSSTALLQFPNRAIGIGIMQGVDSARRAPIYLFIVMLSLAVGLGCYLGARVLRARMPSWFTGARSCFENELCAMFCALGSVALISRVAAGHLDGLDRVYLAFGAFCAVVGCALARRLAEPGPAGRLIRRLLSWNTALPMALLLWPSLQLGSILQSASPGSAPWLARLGTALLPCTYGVALFCLLRRPRREAPGQIRKAFVTAAAPFLAFPFLCVVANELAYALLPSAAFSSRRIALLLFAGLTLLSGLLFTRVYRGQLVISPRRLLARFCFPIVIFGAVLIMFHESRLPARQWDMLHDGEQITAIQQLLRFDKWPFVDVWPAHGLFDYVGLLYAKLNGFKPYELNAWNSVPFALSATAVYGILALVTTPLFAFAATMVLPIDAIFPLPIYSASCTDAVLLGVGLLLVWAVQRPSAGRYVVLSAAACSSFFWTPVVGVTSIAAVLALLVLNCRTASDRRAARHGLEVFAATGVCIFMVYVLVLKLCQRPVFETLALVLAYIRADAPLGSRASIIDQFDNLAFVQYVLLPGIGMLYLAKLALHAVERRPLGRVELVLGFLTLTSFVLFPRTLARHSLAETFQPLFFPFLALMALMPGNAGRTVQAPERSAETAGNVGIAQRITRTAVGRAWFCAGLALYVIGFPRVSRVRDPLVAFSLHDWRADEPRYAGPVPFYPELKAFLDETLRPGETFLELLNMPFLYTTLDRELPGHFFLVSFFYGTDGVQDTFLKRFDEFGGSRRVPVVLLESSGGPMHVDGVVNTLRSYRIAERVFRDYVPFGAIDGFEVWIARERWNEARERAKPVPLPFGEPKAYSAHDLESADRVGDAIVLVANGPDPHLNGAVNLDAVSPDDLASRHSVRFLYRTTVPGTVELFYRYGNDTYEPARSGKVSVHPSPPGQWQIAEVPIPVQGKLGRRLNGLRIDPPDGSRFAMRSLQLVLGDPPRRAPEATYLAMLPFIWGNFDARLAEGGGKVLERLEVSQPATAPLAFDLVLSKPADTSTGNYLRLCLRLPLTELPRTRPASWKSVKHGDSWQSAGKIRLAYGSPPSEFAFDLVQPDPTSPGLSADLVESFQRECKIYLVRLSSQYSWSSQRVRRLQMQANASVSIESAELLAGD
jgi:hypothetical protein